MSRDIRSFFQPATKKSNQTTDLLKKRPLALDSSDDDIVESTPNKEPKKDKKPAKRQKKNAISSDSEDDSQKKPNTPKKVNAADIFGTTPVKQTKVETHKPKKEVEVEGSAKKPNKGKASKNVTTEIGIHDDEDFEKTLLELDEDLLLDNVDVLNKTIDDALKADSKQQSKKTPSRKRKKSEDDSTEIDHDQERYEKKRYSAMLYQKYLNRSGPVHHGEKEYPKGKPDCLKNLCFIRTGVLDSLQNDEFDNLVKEHGGRTVHAVSRKVNYVVVGEDAGPAKLAKASEFNIRTISENEFLDLILTKSGMKPKYAIDDATTSEKQHDDSGDHFDESKDKDKKPPVKIDKVRDEVKHPVKIKKEEKTPTKPLKNHLDESKDQNKKPAVKVGKTHDEVKFKKEEKTPQKQLKKEVVSPKPSPSTSTVSVKKEKTSVSDLAKTPENMMAWTEKYKPNNIKSIIGQQGDKSNMKKLMVWLQNWHNHHGGKTKTKLIKPSPWAKNDDGGFFKCALLSGPPGVGKTTTATLVAKELGYDVVEFNASDTRSKKLLHEEVSQLLSTTSLAGFFKDGSATTKKHVLLMDEVDGMAGNEDRGGMQELINLIKNTHIPIICMCNDRNHTKVRSLANYCFDLRFSKPRLEQIRGAMMSVCHKENLKITPNALSEIITGAGMDIRQTLNHLFLWTANNKNLTADEAGSEAKTAKKDTIMGPWEVIKKVFSEEDHKTMTLADKSRLFFYDYSIGPLFVQENYLQVVPHCPKKELLDRFAKTADSLSMSDMIDRKIRSGNNWSLLEVQAMYASVLPGHYLEGHFGGQINFPGWLGKNSKRGKFQRLLSELQAHMRTSISGSRTAVNLDYIYHIRDKIITPLVKQNMEGVHKSVEVMNSYNLLREDFDSLLELSHWPQQRDPMTLIDSKVKAAFTRAYNKEVVKLPYAVTSTFKKKTTATPLDEEGLYGEEEGELSAEDDDDITKDNMITTKKPSKQTTNKAKNTVTEKKTGKGRGKKTK